MTKRLACVHFVRELRAELGGVVKAAIDLCQSMAEFGHDVLLTTFDAKDAPPPFSGVGSLRIVEVPHARLGRPLLSRQAIGRLEQLISAADIAHLHTPWELANLQLARILRRRQVPYVVSVHGMLDHYSMRQKGLKKQAFLALGGRRLFADATAVHFTAQAEKEQALTYIPGADRAVVQPCAMDLASYASLPGAEPAFEAFPQMRREARRILFLSRVHPKKGVDLLIRAAGMLKLKSLDIQLLIAGPGDDAYLAELRQIAEQSGAADVTHFLGMVDGVVKRSLYQAADVFVLPTHQENFGLVLPEAMACGTPVVTTRGTDIWQELEQAGAKVVGHKALEIAAAIEQVLADPSEAKRLGQRGREYIHQWLDPHRVAKGYDAMYRDALARGIPPFRQAATRPQGETLAAR
jgi:glycosyltransferase involved in cell wall biosynthesis